VNARMLVNTLRDATVVPAAALQRGPEFSFVYVLQQDSTVAIREVEPGITNGGETVIQSGLQPGETVVTDGLDKLQPGSRVTTRTGESNRSSEERGTSPEDSRNSSSKTSPAPRRQSATPGSETDTRVSPPEKNQKHSDKVSTDSGRHVAGLEQHPNLPTSSISNAPNTVSAISASTSSDTLKAHTAVQAESPR